MSLLDKFKKEHVNKQAWLDWLSDEPPTNAAQAELRRKRLEQATRQQYQGPRSTPPAQPVHPSQAAPTAASRPSAQATPPANGVSIQINIPQFRKPQFHRLKTLYALVQAWAKRLTKKQVIYTSVVLAIILVSWVGAAIVKHQITHKAVAKQGSVSDVAGGGSTVADAKPDFTPVVPSGKSNLATPDNVHARYDGTKHSYSFVDTISNKQVTVSQQRVATAELAAQDASQAAKGLQNVNTVSHQLKTGWGTANVLINQKYNTIMAVFSVQDKLVFIQSSTIIADEALTKYVNSLD